MTNLFLKVNKDFFKLGLNPTEILLLAQIMEFNTNTGDFFMSDKALAEQFGVSESTIKRELKKLEEELGFITRETKNVKGGRERHIKINLHKIEEKLTSVKMSLDECQQGSNCSLTSVNLNFDKEQIDTIKDKLIDKEKDNIIEMFHPSDESISLSEPQEPKEEEKYQRVSKKEMLAYGVPYKVVDESKSLYRIIATNKIVRAI